MSRPRRVVRLGVTLLAAAVLTGASIQASQADPLEELFGRARAVQASVRTLAAGFTETTTSALLRDPLVETGTLLASIPVRVVMTYTAPTPKTVALDGTRLVVSWPSRAAREEINIAETQRRVQKYFVDASAKDLRSTFTIDLSRDPAVGDAYRLDMTPRRRQVAEGLQRLRIWIDPVRFMMVRMTMDFPEGDSKTLELHDIRTNVAIDESAFALLAPPK